MRKLIILFALLAGCTLPGCEKKEYLYQDVSSRIWLGRREAVGTITVLSDSSVSSFVLKPITALLDTLYITANLTGKPAPTDRPFVLEVIKDSSNVNPADYTVGPTVLPANAFSAQVAIIVKKNVQGLNLLKERAKLVFRFVPNEHFLNGEPNRDMFRVIWYNFLAQPASWFIIQPMVGAFSQAKYRFIIDVLGVTEFTRYQGNTNVLLGIQSILRKALKDYNENPANAGRPEGWPYLDDNGQPLVI
jgi:hypothetical protein